MNKKLQFNSAVYRDSRLIQIAMPLGGIGSGCICLNGQGGLQDFAIRNRPDTTALPDGQRDNGCRLCASACQRRDAGHEAH